MFFGVRPFRYAPFRSVSRKLPCSLQGISLKGLFSMKTSLKGPLSSQIACLFSRYFRSVDMMFKLVSKVAFCRLERAMIVDRCCPRTPRWLSTLISSRDETVSLTFRDEINHVNEVKFQTRDETHPGSKALVSSNSLKAYRHLFPWLHCFINALPSDYRAR